MAENEAPLTEEERAELEQLRAEKAEREERQRVRAEREELARLKAERARAQSRADEDRRIAEVRARNAKLMEPDEDLHMPIAQKIVLAGLAILAIVLICMTFFGK